MGGAMDTGKNIFIFLSFVGVCIWIGMIWKAQGDDKLAEACRPLAFTTDSLHSVVAGLTGTEARWTVRFQNYLMGGCYYFMGIVLRPGQDDIEDRDIQRATQANIGRPQAM